MAELFQTTPQNITTHIKGICEEGELAEPATYKELLQVRREGDRTVRRRICHYNLDMILAVGYRVRSHRGTQFRQWATERLREYLVKGFTMGDGASLSASLGVSLGGAGRHAYNDLTGGALCLAGHGTLVRLWMR